MSIFLVLRIQNFGNAVGIYGCLFLHKAINFFLSFLLFFYLFVFIFDRPFSQKNKKDAANTTAKQTAATRKA